MQNNSNNLSPLSLAMLSPDLFFGECGDDYLPFLNIEPRQSQILLHRNRTQQCSNLKMSEKTVTKVSSRDDKKKIAGIKSREKKKRYVESLEDSVKNLMNELEGVEAEVAKTKDQLLQAINSSKTGSNEHSSTYAELQSCIISEYPDLDKINLLLDTLRYRIGADGRERQAKIDYNFKQIVNGLFPALHRYLMFTAENELDIYGSYCNPQEDIMAVKSWTKELFQSMKLTSDQITSIKQRKQWLVKRRAGALENIASLNALKTQLKEEQKVVESEFAQLRSNMDPISCAGLIIFCEKYKYRRELSIDRDFDEEGGLPSKKVKVA